ncbi:MAG: ABC transporter substrate-binding protein [Chloroflexi bacterium]|nr:ABC transporter substrate-binding protein [Chloroflexota bacterium]
MVRGAISELPALESSGQFSPAELQQMVERAVAASAAAAPKPPAAIAIGSMVQAGLAAAATSAVTKDEIEALITKATEAAALAAAEAALLAAPQPVVRAAPVAGAAGQKYGGTVKIGVIDFGTMDPALMGLSEGSSLYSELTYDNGTVLWYDGAVTPWALESWTTNAELTQYTFDVRQGIKFHSGKELKAEDIKFTFDRILDEATASPLRGQIEYIEKITAVDDYTVVFDLDGANVFLPAQISIYHARILPSDVDITQITSKEFGSGAFTLGEHNPAERTVMNANPDYWRAGVPYLDQVILFYMPEQTTRVEALKSGAIDVILEPSFGSLDSLEANPNIVIQEAPTAGVRVLDFHTDREPFNNKDLRKAFQYAVDRDFVRDAALFGRGANANDHPVGINDEYYWDDQPIVQQDIERAKAYLDAAGYPDGIDVVLTTTDATQKLELALAFKESVAEAGIRIEINNADSTTYWEEFWMNPCCPFVASSWGPRPAPEALSVQMRGGGVWNESYYDNSRLDELLDLASAEGDFVSRKEYYREIQEILIEDVPVLYLMYNPKIIAHRDRVSGTQVNPNLATYLMEEWWINE